MRFGEAGGSVLPMPNAPKSRLAPTPSGLLHLGNAFSFILTWLLVRKAGGSLHLRIDDLDAPRVNPESVEDIFRQIEWLGLDYDSGPTGPDDLERRHSQRLRTDRYRQVLTELAERSGKVYACRCSRSQIKAVSLDGLYPGTCRHSRHPLAESDVAWRISVPPDTAIAIPEMFLGARAGAQVQLDQEMGDFVVFRKEGIPAYQIASVTDDFDLEIDLIVRGQDLLASTAAQIFLAEQLSWPSIGKAAYLHHPLLMGRDSLKLSKSKGSLSLSELRQAWGDPRPVYQMVAGALALPLECGASLETLLEAFSPEHLRIDLRSAP